MSGFVGSPAPVLSIVIPVLNDAPALRALLDSLARELPEAEMIVADGGSHDMERAEFPESVRWISTEASRGRQLNRGAQIASGQWLWLLHADSVISAQLVAQITSFINAPTHQWGRFDVAIERLPIVSWFANNRSALTGLCTGDQGIFVSKESLQSVGGIPDQPLMEDIELSKRLKRVGQPARLRGPITTSARRWRKYGVVRCVLQMWWFRLRYWAGSSPARLAAEYYGTASSPPGKGESP